MCVNEFIFCEEDCYNIAGLLAIISLSCCNPAGQRTHQLSASARKTPALPKNFCWGILLNVMNELFTDRLRKM